MDTGNQDAFTEGEDHVLRELTTAARDYGLVDQLRELITAAGYVMPNEKGEF